MLVREETVAVTGGVGVQDLLTLEPMLHPKLLFARQLTSSAQQHAPRQRGTAARRVVHGAPRSASCDAWKEDRQGEIFITSFACSLFMF